MSLIKVEPESKDEVIKEEIFFFPPEDTQHFQNHRNNIPEVENGVPYNNIFAANCSWCETQMASEGMLVGRVWCTLKCSLDEAAKGNVKISKANQYAVFNKLKNHPYRNMTLKTEPSRGEMYEFVAMVVENLETGGATVEATGGGVTAGATVRATAGATGGGVTVGETGGGVTAGATGGRLIIGATGGE